MALKHYTIEIRRMFQSYAKEEKERRDQNKKHIGECCLIREI